MCLEAEDNPGSTILYIAPTREQAKRIIIKDVLKVINRKYCLDMRFNRTTMECTFPNGSVIYIMGLDDGPEEMDKALGQKYRLVVIDEGGSWKQDQEKMIEEILEPACADLDGTICMLGMPTSYSRTLFYRITSKPENFKAWSCHKWTWKENPYVRVNMQKLIDRKIAANPRVVETPSFRRMYNGEWVIDAGSLVYKYDVLINSAFCLPQQHEYQYLLGLDLGWSNSTSITIGAYSVNDPFMYFVEVLKKPELDITAVAEFLAFYKQKYNPIKWVVDGASRQAVEELRQRHHFPLEAADKMGKADIIEIMNADYKLGKIKLLPAAEALAEEYGALVWDPTSKKKEEHPACENDAADGALYVWRLCYHYLSEPATKTPLPGSRDEIEAWWEKQAREAQSAKNRDFAIRDFGKDYGFH